MFRINEEDDSFNNGVDVRNYGIKLKIEHLKSSPDSPYANDHKPVYVPMVYRFYEIPTQDTQDEVDEVDNVDNVDNVDVEKSEKASNNELKNNSNNESNNDNERTNTND